MFRGKEVQTRRSKKRKEDDYDSLEQTKHFLAIIWGFYTPSKDAWCEIRIIRPNGKARSYWFRWKLGVEKEAVEWLKKNWNRLRLDSANVYLGVLPKTKFSREELNKKVFRRGVLRLVMLRKAYSYSQISTINGR